MVRRGGTRSRMDGIFQQVTSCVSLLGNFNHPVAYLTYIMDQPSYFIFKTSCFYESSISRPRSNFQPYLESGCLFE
jgi:hypothetical protein